MQWYATGSVQTNASRPDQRCTGFTQAGLFHGSLRKIQAAVRSWKHASTAAALANAALKCSVSSKKSRKYPFERGSCAANSPAFSEPSANATSGAATQRYERCSGAAAASYATAQ